MNPFTDLLAFKDEHWLDDAACTPLRAELFWPDKGGDSGPAKAVCAGCPVKRQCLEYALKEGEINGIWGGLDPAERKLRRPAISRPANECVNGHDLELVGTRRDGYCRQCDRDRWERYQLRRKQGLVAARGTRKKLRVVDGGAA